MTTLYEKKRLFDINGGTYEVLVPYDLQSDGSYAEKSLGEPASHAALITPDNDNDLANPTRAISFAADGALKVDTVGGETITIPSGALASGMLHPLRVTRVYATGTTATGIVGVF